MSEVSRGTAVTDTVLLYRSPSGRTEVARSGNSVKLSVINGRDTFMAEDAERLATALSRAFAEPEVLNAEAV